MSNEDFQDFVYITGAAARIRTYLDKHADPAWMQSVIDFYNENMEFPGDTFIKILDIVKKVDDLRLDLVGIANNLDTPEGAETLFLNIFFPPDPDQDYSPKDEEEGQEIEFEPESGVAVVRSMDPDALEQHQKTLSTELADLLCIHPDIAFAILKAGHWKYDNVVLDCSNDHCEAALKRLSIPTQMANHPLDLVPGGFGECDVCFEECELLKAPCGHAFCRECWKADIESHIAAGQDNIICQAEGCHCPLSQTTILDICGQETAGGYQKFLLESQIAQDQQLRHCIRPNCPNVLTVDAVGLCGVATCSCGQRMCWHCRGEPHAPLACDNIPKWKALTKEETLQAKWVVENTKPCPKCHVRIEKNGGCNHMTCHKCSYEFCWICGHEWKSHAGNGYSCNKFVDFDDTDKSGIPQCSLVRLDHYNTRYIEQLKSIEAEKSQRDFFKKRLVDTFYEQGKVPMDESVKVSDDVFNALDAARNVSVWSYPHAFFMKPESSDLRLFEHVQTNMEFLIEQLSDMVENQFTSSIYDFKQVAALLAKNTEVLLKHVDQYG